LRFPFSAKARSFTSPPSDCVVATGSPKMN
jgi:hypothetical protein